MAAANSASGARTIADRRRDALRLLRLRLSPHPREHLCLEWHAELGEQREGETDLQGRPAVLDIGRELPAHARGCGKVVESDATGPPHGADGEASISGCPIRMRIVEFSRFQEQE